MSQTSYRAVAVALLLALLPQHSSATDPDPGRAKAVTVYDGNRPADSLRAATNTRGDTAFVWACRFNWRDYSSREWSLCLRTRGASGALSRVTVLAPHREGRVIDLDDPEPGFEVVMDDKGVVTTVWLSDEDGKVSVLARRWSRAAGLGPVLTLAEPETRTWGPHQDVEATIDADGTVVVGWAEGDDGTAFQPVARVIAVDGTVSDVIPLGAASSWMGGLHAVGREGGPAAFVWAAQDQKVWYRSFDDDGGLDAPVEIGVGTIFDAGTSPAGDVVVGYYRIYDHHGRTVQFARVVGRDGALGDEVVLERASFHRVALNDAGRIFYFSTYAGRTGVETFAADGTSTPYAVVTEKNLDRSYLNSLDPVVTRMGDVVVSWAGPGRKADDRRLYVGRISADGSPVGSPTAIAEVRRLYDPVYDLSHFTWRAPDGHIRFGWSTSLDNGRQGRSSVHETLVATG